VIGGRPGWLYGETQRRAAEGAAAGRVLLPGFVADEDLPALYSLAELFVFPSLYEGFGIPVLEAMACGTPVVTCTNSSLPEAAGNAALLVEATDSDALAQAMARVVGDSELRRTMIAAGSQQAARFTWQRSAQALLTAYASVAT
jgi:glycosyltransferase involved in cell wall biosynthesis